MSASKTPNANSVNWSEGWNINTHGWRENKGSETGSYNQDSDDPYHAWESTDDTPISAQTIYSELVRLKNLFGFQRDNVENIFDYLLKMLDSRAARLNPTTALRSIHADYISGPNSNFKRWFFVAKIDELRNDKSLEEISDLSAKANWDSRFAADDYKSVVTQVGLYLLCWGEANNIRFMPECLCFIFYCCFEHLAYDEENLSLSKKISFLDFIITPLYSVLKRQCFKNHKGMSVRTDEDHATVIGYDDINQLFWSKEGLLNIVLKSGGKLMEISPERRLEAFEDIDWDKCFKKTYKEIRSWFHVFVDFKRVIIIHLSLFWYFHSYHFYPLYTPNYLVSKDGQPPFQLRLSIMSLASILVTVFSAFTTVCEFLILPTIWKELCPIITRLLLLLLFSSAQAITLYLSYYFDFLRDLSNVGLTFSVLQFFGSMVTVTYFAVTPTISLLHIQSDRKQKSDLKCFTHNFSKLGRTQTITSIALWVMIFTCKCIESYFFLTLSTRDSVRELYMMNMNCVGDLWMRNVLCSAQPRIVLTILIGLEALLYFVDTYLWYIIWISIYSVVRSFYIGSSIWTPWKNIFSSLPKRINSKLLTQGSVSKSETDSRVPKLWNAIIISMYREHFLTLKQVQKLLYNHEKVEDFSRFQEPRFFVSQEDESFKSSILEKDSESSRRLTFFAQSLSNPMPESRSITTMPSFTVLVPHYNEKIILLTQELEEVDGDFSNLSVIEYLKHLYPSEWTSFMRDSELLAQENTAKISRDSDQFPLLIPKSGNDDLDIEIAMRTRVWASLRTQTLYRTVSGFMNYSRAIKILYDLEQFGESDNYNDLRLRLLEKMAIRKFKMIVSIQRYMQLDQQEKDNVEFLVQAFPELQIAYIEEELDRNTQKMNYYLCLIDGSCPKFRDQEREPKYRIKLSGYPILGDGKSDNQNHSLIFTRGEYIQLVDANQDNYFEECLKIRNVLAEFEEENFQGHSDKHKEVANNFPVAIVGTREYIFSQNMGVLGDIAAGKEQTFGTLFARTLAYIGGKLHYGHPDFLNVIFMTTRGGISKAQKGLHLNEDIYAGMNAVMRGGRIKYCEYMQCGKGRDLGFVSILNFVTKIGAGMGEQLISREYFYLGSQLPIDRLLSFYYAHAGYHLNNLCIIMSLEIFLLLGINLGALARNSSICEYDKNRPFTDPKIPANCLNIIPVVLWLWKCIYSIFVACVISFVPLVIQEVTEKGFYRALTRVGKQIVALSPIFEIFVCKTYTTAMVRDIKFGGAHYIGTGRNMATRREPFVTLYTRYANVSLKFGAESLLLIACISKNIWGFLLLYVWIIIMGLLFSPFFYNPNQFRFHDFASDYREFLIWMFSAGKSEGKENSWATFTKTSRGQITGVRAHLKLGVENVIQQRIRPSRAHLLLTMILPYVAKTLAISCAYLFPNSQSEKSFGTPTSSIETLIILSSLPLIFNMTLLLVSFIISLIFGPLLMAMFSRFPTFIFFVVQMMSVSFYLLVFELIWFIQDFDFSQACLAIIFLINYQRVVLTTINILFLSRELSSDNSNKAWWSGKWIRAGLGWRVFTQPTREYLCKVSELAYFAADLFLGQFLILTQSLVCLIPFTNHWHSAMLLWIKSKHYLQKKKKEKTKKERRNQIIAATAFLIVVFCNLAIMVLLIFGPILVDKKYGLDNILPQWLIQLKQKKSSRTNGNGLKSSHFKRTH